jgi:type I restriction enzyme, S subunit
MKSYLSYKDSGVGWIGEIPREWKTVKLKNIFYEKKHTHNPELECGSISFGKVITKDDDKVPITTKESYQEVLKGEYLINPLNLNYDLKSLRIGLSEINVVVSSGYIVIKEHIEINKLYFKWLLHVYDVLHMKLLGNGIRQTISFNHISISLLTFPPLPEQQQISNYLDQKTKQIDDLIEKTEQKIKLLKEKRTSLINHCVTKGLDPNVEMKDSGVEWVGEIPDHWTVKRLKYIFTPREERSETGEEELLSVTIPDGVVRRRDYISNDDHISRSESLVGYKVCHEMDLVNNIMKMSFRCLGISNYDGIVSPAYSVFYFKNSENIPSYWNYLLRIDRFVVEYRKRSKGIQESRMRLYNDYFLDLFSYLPPLPEQQQISNYLDQKTKQIDDLIGKTKQKIELLKEKRTSLINHCVTKGLDPNVEMKDSGVEWIGEIPREWGVKPLKYKCNYNVDSLGNDTEPDYELDYIEISDVNSDGEILNKTHMSFKDSPSRCRRILKKNDVFISTVRTYLKSIGFVGNEVDNLICSTGYCVVSPTEGIIPKLLFYIMRSNWFISKVVSSSEGVSYPSIQSTKLVDIKILVLPLPEQQQIVTHLDKETQKIDTLIKKENQRIDLLKEYRQSLISEVVTGKIDVRDEVLQ